MIDSSEEAENECEPNYRFRRMVSKKNDTERPSTLYSEIEYEKTLIELKLDKKSSIYLEQDNCGFSGTSADIIGGLFLTIRIWDEQNSCPIDLLDIVIHKKTTLANLKIFLSQYYHHNSSKMVIVEEETKDKFNVLIDDSLSLENYGLSSGDILYIELLNDKNVEDLGKYSSKVKSYYQSKQNEITLAIEETYASFKNRIKQREAINELNQITEKEDKTT